MSACLRECENSGKKNDRDAVGELSSGNFRSSSKAGILPNQSLT
jgi:hypothetical protein